MKNILLCLSILFLFNVHQASAQSGMWTWVHGDSVPNTAGNPGQLGVPSPLNIPQSVYEPVHWIDSDDNLWIYGGYNRFGDLYQTLWKYNPYTNIWTWMQGSLFPNQGPVYGTLGIPSPTNTPGSRNCSVAWIDSSGNFWLMGGYGTSNATYADLWKLDTTTFEWTWISGSPNAGVNNTLVIGIPTTTGHPQAVAETNCAWTDNQNQLWYYGGIQDYYLRYYNYVTKFNISTNEWTLVRAAGFNSQPVYGVQGVPAATNDPGSRIVFARWKDSSGDFWFMNGATVSIGSTDRNDVWRYNPASNEWTWMTGPQTTNDSGSYSIYCSLNNDRPAARVEDKAVYRDKADRVWLFGGTTANGNDNWNDLWIFDQPSLQFRWMHGSNLLNQAGSYGQLNVPSTSNIPNSRDGAILFGDSLCNIYLFGGMSRKVLPKTYNDVWKFSPDTNCLPCVSALPQASFTAPGEICPGTCTDFTNTSSNTLFYQWSFPGGVPSSSTDASPTNICYNNSGSYDVTLIASGPNGSDTLTMTNYIQVFPFPPAQGITQSGDTLFANPGAVSYQWYYDGNLITGATNYFYVATGSGNFNVVATDTNDCEVEAGIFDVIAGINPLSDGENEGLSIFPNPVHKTLSVHLPKNDVSLQSTGNISIYNMLGEKIRADILFENKYNLNAADITIDVSKLFPGMYYLEVAEGKKILLKSFIRQ